MTRETKIHVAALITLSVATLLPLLIHMSPFYALSPDILYVEGKTLWVASGDFFIDPVTGYLSMHPPWYHVVLAGLNRLGISVDAALVLLTVFNIAGLYLLVYLIVREQFNTTVALGVCLLLPFAFEFMALKKILLATSFYFSIPVFLSGVYLYLTRKKFKGRLVLTGVAWGTAFLISPTYLFILAFIFCYDIVHYKSPRRMLLLLVPFAVTISPFYIQLYQVHAAGMSNNYTFALWRGFPDWNWLKELLLAYISPVVSTFSGVPVFIHLAIIVLFFILVIIRKRLPGSVLLLAAAYVATYYFLLPQYAIRIQLFLSLIIIAHVLHFTLKWRTWRIGVGALVLAIAIYGFYRHYDYVAKVYSEEAPYRNYFQKSGALMHENIGRFVDPGTYILCSRSTYRFYILPYFRIHGLGAFRTMRYFQLNDRLSDQLDNDYHLLTNATDVETLNRIAGKYNISFALIAPADTRWPVYNVLTSSWKTIYGDGFFTGFSRAAEEGTSDQVQGN
jgi:hypothetical protein